MTRAAPQRCQFTRGRARVIRHRIFMSFEYPVAVENRRSRRVAEGLGGILAGRACCASRVVALHPGALARYAEKIGRIHDAVVTGTAFDDREFAEALCELVES